MTGDILLLAEHKNGELNSITLELMGKGRELADKSGAQLTVLILGFKVGVLAEALLGCDVDAVMVADDPMLEHYSYETYCKVICNVVRNTNPSLFLLGYTY